MAEGTSETLIGAAVVAVAAGFMVYGANTADIAMGGSNYELVAKFRKAEGITVGGDVRLSGVKIGTISSVELDPDTYQALLRFQVRDEIKLPEDSDAKIASEGLLGGAHVAIGPGASDFMLENGDEIEYTQGSISILDLVGQAITSTGSTGSD